MHTRGLTSLPLPSSQFSEDRGCGSGPWQGWVPVKYVVSCLNLLLASVLLAAPLLDNVACHEKVSVHLESVRQDQPRNLAMQGSRREDPFSLGEELQTLALSGKVSFPVGSRASLQSVPWH